MLREKYGVARARVFGAGSDIYPAVEGLSVSKYWDAATDAFFLDKEMTIDLMDRDSCSETLWTVVEREGVDL
jgi:hypothetical protein